ncbi:hypothetical protein HYH03_014633 [Edaphochlamys debaryana]|uniref:Dirigent protein n=1 Tax=Edaphochlamys debaryana TaxID=47281 RepID=A0A835XNC5_9CHLO|nr:hypothetical protein HYH03_014633 [Edaphochlamys debaryana]|eukprot:KAG2486704.1 hypothetical protein HYH03_014633 [Edaphochlamys debaryana]
MRTLSVATVAFAALLAFASASKTPRDYCQRTLVVTELFDPDGFVVPLALRNASAVDITVLIGYTSGFQDPVVWGGSGTSSRKAGTLMSTCFLQSLTATGGMVNYCSSTLAFGEYGSISWMGPFYDEQGEEFHNGITGGTGIYLGASGSVRTNVLKTGEAWRYQFTLLDRPKC